MKRARRAEPIIFLKEPCGSRWTEPQPGHQSPVHILAGRSPEQPLIPGTIWPVPISRLLPNLHLAPTRDVGRDTEALTELAAWISRTEAERLAMRM